MSRLLRERRPCLLLELHGTQAAADVQRQLVAAGYRLHKMQTGYPEVDAWDPARLPKHIVALAAEVTG
jgi:hypothetical protein